MTATVGLRSGLPRHWTGSLLELNCNGPETLSDYPDISTENSFYFNWRTEGSSELKNLQGQSGNGFFCMTQGVYTKQDNTRVGEHGYTAPSTLTSNQLFRLRQLLSLCIRYGKNLGGYSGQSSWNFMTCSESDLTFDATNLSDTSKQDFMRSLNRPGGFANDHRLVEALFDGNLESFPNETGFLLITKSKRRHCSSEGDLTLVNNKHHNPVSSDRLFTSALNVANSSVDSETELEEQALVSSSSVETLIGPIESPTLLDVEFPMAPPSDDSSTNESTNEIVPTQSHFSETSSLDSDSSYRTTQDDGKLEKTSELTSVSPSPTDPTGSIQLNKPETPVLQPPPTLSISTDDDMNLMKCVLPNTRVIQSELSSPQVRKLERENSASSGSSSRLVKTVSFADQVGQSLTEVFLFRKTEEESLIPDYEDDFDGPFFNFQHKSKISSFGKFTRLRNKRYIEKPSAFNYGTQPSLSPTNLQKFPRGNEPTDTGRHLWFLGFTQPAAQYYEFRQRVENRCVSLENITLTQPEESSQQVQQTIDDRTQAHPPQLPYLSGTIKVKNVHFDKKVWLRITTNHWVTYVDYPATYSAQLSSGGVLGSIRFDTFTFRITTSDYPREASDTERIEFAIRYCAGPDGSHGQFWDNNEGRNYVIERRRVDSGWSSPTNSSPALLGMHLNNPHNSLSSYSSHGTSLKPPNTCNPYTLDYRPNFAGISSFTDYRAWEHFASESIYY